MTKQKLMEEIKRIAGEIEFGRLDIELTINRGNIVKAIIKNKEKNVLLDS
ncbi:MAG: hypothetical protein ACTSUF_07740 [Candidatus Heimdallarchaeaceae archaeon]